MATISFTTKFDLSVATPIFILEDTSAYVAQGIALVNVNSVFSITSPSGTVIYNNTDYSNGGCDIRNSVSRINQTTIPLPLGADGFPESGTYIITESTYDNNLLVYSTDTNTYEYDYVRPEVAITQTTDCVSPLFTSTDSTTYTVNSIVPTITREHTITFPVGSGLSPLVGTAATMTRGYEQFANGTQSTTIVSDLIYVFTDGLTVVDEITGYQSVTVDCTDSCAIYCCLRSVEQQMIGYSTTNTALFASTRSLFTEAMGIIGMVTLARTCNKSADISGYLTEVKTLLNCTDDCSCSGDAPALVTGLGGLVNNVVVNSSGSPIVVTPVVVGTTTTYTITFNAALLTTINSLYNTVVVAGANTTVTDSGIVGLIRTFTVATTAASPILYNTTTPVSTVLGAMTVLQSYTLPINTLATNGDVLELSADFDTDGTTQAKAVDLRIGGTVCHTKVTEFRQTMSQKASRLVVRVTRQSTTTLFITFLQANSNGSYQTLGDGKLFYETGFSVSDLSANTTLFEVRGRNLDGAPTETINCAQLVVTYYKK
ncbi:MAG: hypothetical protein V4721_10180 [Bacteroidota bacterium]